MVSNSGFVKGYSLKLLREAIATQVITRAAVSASAPGGAPSLVSASTPLATRINTRCHFSRTAAQNGGRADEQVAMDADQVCLRKERFDLAQGREPEEPGLAPIASPRAGFRQMATANIQPPNLDSGG